MSNPFDQVANLIAQAANTVSVLANETVEIPNSNINFNNTMTVNVSVYTNPSKVGRANVEFSVNTSSILSGLLLPPTVATAQTSRVFTTPVYVTVPFLIPANKMKVGSVFKVTLGASYSTGNNIDINLKLGANGNVSDSNLISFGGVDTGVGSDVGFMEFLFIVRSVGNNANGIINQRLFATHFSPVTFDTTVDNYLGATWNVVSPPETDVANIELAIVQQIA